MLNLAALLCLKNVISEGVGERTKAFAFFLFMAVPDAALIGVHLLGYGALGCIGLATLAILIGVLTIGLGSSKISCIVCSSMLAFIAGLITGTYGFHYGAAGSIGLGVKVAIVVFNIVTAIVSLFEFRSSYARLVIFTAMSCSAVGICLGHFLGAMVCGAVLA